jgi:REP element-mobilizing transposase RayT
MNRLPRRKQPVHHPLHLNAGRNPIIFLTVCTRERKPVLANPNVHQALHKAWGSSTRWLVGRYVILPDHLHLFCAPTTENQESLSDWVMYWKRSVSKSVPEIKSWWQSDFWDRQLRTGENYSSKWEYVRNNPVRHDLVNLWSEWPYQGVIHELDWHDG